MALTGVLAMVGATPLAALPSPQWTSEPVETRFVPGPPAVFPLSAYTLTRTLQGAQVCGALNTDEVWVATTGPYIVTCDVRVGAGVSLHIDPGVAVQFQHAGDDLIVSGDLRAVGTEAAPIVFQPVAGTEPGSWGRVAFMVGSTGLLDHARLEYGGHEDGLLYLASEHVQVLNSVVQYSADIGIVIQTGSQLARQGFPIARPDILAHMLFIPSVYMATDNQVPPSGPVISATRVLSNTGVYGGGLYNESGNPTIQGNTFAGNVVAGIPWQHPGLGAGLYNGSGNPIIRNNVFDSNGQIGLYAFGGGLYNESGSPLISNNTFSRNRAGYRASGGGLYNATGNPTIVNNTFADNLAEQDGGGLFNQSGSPVIRHNSFFDNAASGRLAAGHGGGLANRTGGSSIEYNLFAGNNIGSIYDHSYGGGVYNGASNATIRGNIFSHNTTSGFGGGLHNSGSSATIQNNLFIGNKANYGGGLANEHSDSIIENNIFDSNTAVYTGGGLENISGSPIIRNNTFVGNAFLSLPNPGFQIGGGLYIGSGSPEIRNNIFASNHARSGGGIFVYSGAPSADYNNVWNNTGGDHVGILPGLHDLAVNPLFVDAASGDVHLTASSACIDAGDPVDYAATDFDGDARPLGAGPDLGADEFRSVTRTF